MVIFLIDYYIAMQWMLCGVYVSVLFPFLLFCDDEQGTTENQWRSFNIIINIIIVSSSSSSITSMSLKVVREKIYLLLSQYW